MELWLLLGILSYISYGISTTIDKYFMNKDYNPLAICTYKLFFNGTILLITGLIFFKPSFNLNVLPWAFLLGSLYAISGVLYFKVLKLKDVQIVMPYFQSSKILLIFVGSLIIFGETVNLYNIIGVILIIIGVYSILSQNGFKVPKLDKAIILVLLMVIIITIYSLLVKKLVYNIQPIDLAIMMYFSSMVVLVVFSFFINKQRNLLNINNSKVVAASFFGAIATLMLFYAVSVGNASKVYPIVGLQSVFLFISASIFLKEKFYWHRLIGTITVFIGIYLISI